MQATKRYTFLAIATLIFSLPALPAAARGRVTIRPSAIVPINDLVDIVIHNRSVIGIDAARGRVRKTRLMVSEDVLWVGTRGAVGIVVTNRRVLGITAASAVWDAVQLGVHESEPSSILLGDRVALIVTSRRAIGLSSSGDKFVQSQIGPNEKLVDALVSDNVAVLITSRRLLGFSGFLPGIVSTRIGVHEDLEYASSLPNFVTVGTDDRLLIFNAPSASWQAERVSLHW